GDCAHLRTNRLSPARGNLPVREGPELSPCPGIIAAYKQLWSFSRSIPRRTAMASRAKRKWKYRQNRIQPGLKRQLVSTGLWNGDTVVSDVPGEQKMSSVLLYFVAPYTAMGESDEQISMTIHRVLIV